MLVPTIRSGLSACLLLCVVCAVASAADASSTLHKNSVTVVLAVDQVVGDHAQLVATFTPDNDAQPLHLYSKDLVGDVGVPTKLELKPGGAAHAAGPLTADREPHASPSEPNVTIYPEGPVTLRLPITLPTSSDGAPVPVSVTVSYMACSATFCKLPVPRGAMEIALPSLKASAATAPPAPAASSDPAALREAVRAELEAQRPALEAAMAEAARRAIEQSAAERGGIRWLRPHSVADAERLIAEAHAAGRPALLDFTGPSCVNCQTMEKTVFRLPAVAAAWNRASPISINTDPPNDALADWQQARFHTQNRPLYVRLDAKGGEARWSEVFAPTNREALDRFLAFLGGGGGSDKGTGDSAGQFVWLALLGGLFTLLMPCTYPMIPFTMNFFAKQAAAGQRLAPLAAFYAFGIIACFVGLGVLITGVLGANLATVSGHPVTNLVIGALFVVLGLSLLGAFLLRLPAGFEDRLGGGRAGYLGALVMGLTFAITAFSCTAPFAGSVLAAAVASGDANGWTRAVVGMAIYSSAIAVPFFLLAISPGALKKLPKAGAWMNEFKVVGGLVELAAALKFLAICDYAWGWGVVGRTTTIAAWAAVSLFIAAYVLGRLRLSGDQPVPEIGLGRVLVAMPFIALGLWFLAGLVGANLGLVEGFFPGDAAPGSA